jgi:CHAT domain-containing protein/Tfp pilus assembly protein PilF
VRALGAAVLGVLSVLGVLIGLACGHPPAGSGDDGTEERISLASGASYVRTIAGRHRFHFASPAGRFLHLIVEQRRIDVKVSLRDPAGRLLFEVDSPSGAKGPEEVLAVTQVAGEHTLILEPYRAGQAGAIELRVRELRRASAEDRRLATATAAYARAELRLDNKDVKSAILAYREALPGFASLGRREEEARTQWRLGRALLKMGELTETAEVLDQAAAGFRGLGDAVGEARALNDLGTAFRLLGEPARALAAHRRALDLYRGAKDDEGQATSLNDLGLALESAGDLQGALDRYEEALALWRKVGERKARAVTMQNLGSLYVLIGHDEQGMDLLQGALRLLPSGNQREGRERIGILIAVGWAYYLVGRPEMALDHYREAIALARAQDDRLTEAGIWDRQGSALRALHRYEEARASYSKALAMSRAAKSPKNQGHTLANLGWLDLENGAVERGRTQLREAADLLAASGDPNGEAFARVGICHADRRLGAFDEARREIETAVRRVEEMRAGLEGPMSRGQFLATRYNAFEEQVALLMDLHRRESMAGYDRQALEVAEKARARNLSEEIAGDRDEPSADASRRRKLQDEIQELDTRRQTLAQADPRDPRLRGLDVQLREKGMEIDRMAVSRAARPGFNSLDAAGIQALADEGTLFVVYLLSEPESFAWTVDRRRVEAHVLPGRERIEKTARRLVAALSQAQGVAAQGTAVSASRELSQAILAPIRERLSGRQRLVILADGALHLIPFAALPEPAGAGAEPLLVSHEIVMLPSATFLAEQRRRLLNRRPAPGAVAVIADPIFSLSDERLSPAQEAGTERSSRKLNPGPFPRLAATAREAKAILRLAPPGETFLAEGAAASRDLVASGVLGRYRIVHFATHGLLHPVLPERSGLVLSLYDRQGRRRNGFLSAPEVARLKLPAELVVLSACQTGLGREMRGEGLVGLTQAFFQAGARRVVVSYWNVQDLATAELMARFYQELLGKHLPPAAALRAAQLSIRSEDRWKSPYFWAGFVLHGDWR